ncbi:MAG: hypothetical protein EOP62_11420 [Sphingomonadales bacterium]|nr:MAG: hypothetical protein EOP62_11420 [Sphingomonadales bacterium]
MLSSEDSPPQPDTFALSYGALEKLLISLTGGEQSSIASRFRKLRPKFADDGLLTRPGNRVSYDLSRTLAICAIYQINQLTIPLGHAVDLVVGNWPEIAQACINAGSEETRSEFLVRIYVDAFRQMHAGSTKPASWAGVGPSASTEFPHICLDCRLIVDNLASLFDASGFHQSSLANAFERLDRDFGGKAGADADAPPVPKKVEPGFFGTGPYFERARVLLSADPKSRLSPGEHHRLQAHLDYVEAPAPIDSWKRYIGTEPRKGALVQMLAARGAQLGLASRMIGNVETLRDAILTRDESLQLIGKGEMLLSKLAR